MRDRFPGSMITVAIAAAALSALVSMSITRTSGQAPASTRLSRPIRLAQRARSLE